MSLDVLEVVHFGANHLGVGSRIVHNPFIESGISELCKTIFSLLYLSSEERLIMSCFQINDDNTFEFSSECDSFMGRSVFLRVAKIRRLRMSEESYNHTSWIRVTSNSVERFFSSFKQNFSDFRQSLITLNLEIQLYLNMHMELWFHYLK